MSDRITHILCVAHIAFKFKRNVTQLLAVTRIGFTINYVGVLVGHIEHFADQCGGVPAWLDTNTYYTAFTEGWGLYSENPVLSDDTDTYKDNLLQKYGMVKWQVCIKTKSC